MTVTHDYYGYKMTDDTGFAPCVSKQHLTLACCMTSIRKRASIGAWVAGFGGKRFRAGTLIFLMHVDDEMTFDSYFKDRRFSGRLDNIYRKVSGVYRQIPSAITHKSEQEQKHDLSVDRVLVSTNFAYFGNQALAVPEEFVSLVPYRNCCFDGPLVAAFSRWVLSHGNGVVANSHSPLISNSRLVQIRKGWNSV